MSDPEPLKGYTSEYRQVYASKEHISGINEVDLLALRADMARAILQTERALEANGTPVESIIITRRQRRARLTRRKE